MILLDTHVWLWWIEGTTASLPTAERELLARTTHRCVSAISCLEVAWLVRHGRIKLDLPLDEWFALALDGSGIEILPLTPRIAERTANLPEHHKDPADRVIIATALDWQIPLLSLDGTFRRYSELGALLRPESRVAPS